MVGRFGSWQAGHLPFSGKVSLLRRLAAAAPGAGHTAHVGVRDLGRFVEAMHMFAIHHYLSVSEGWG